MSVRSHLPHRAKDTFTNLQVKMETVIVEEVKLYMKIDDVTWNDLITACFKAYLDESRMAHSEKVKNKIESNSSSKNSCIRPTSESHSLIK